MTGMEMMAGNILKSMGVDKDALLAQANSAAAAIKGADARLTVLEEKINQIHTVLCGPASHLDNFRAHDPGQLTIFETPQLPEVAHS